MPQGPLRAPAIARVCRVLKMNDKTITETGVQQDICVIVGAASRRKQTGHGVIVLFLHRCIKLHLSGEVTKKLQNTVTANDAQALEATCSRQKIENAATT